MEPIVDGAWHHICYLWDNSNGDLKSYVDGVLKQRYPSIKQGVTIPGGGVFLLGQVQLSYDGPFDLSEAFVGRLSGMNLWDHELDGNIIAAMSKGGGSERGNVLSWEALRSSIVGNIKVVPAPQVHSRGRLTTAHQ